MQQGKTASVEIIATFLPKVVVESLLAALNRAGLAMDALTLEPIAAIHVLIPTSMRRLNIALVDIGAGTSDIAITELGAISAYGMVPIAGDEITEAISDEYLLDFPEAEKVKRTVTEEKVAMITDILGFDQEISFDELVTAISNSIDKLAKAIRDEILELNGKAPKAVMLVGGGSLTPELASRLSSHLQLPTNRIAIRGIDAIQNLEKTKNLPTGPHFVTPLGIAIAARENPVHYISLEVNNRTVRLFDMKQLNVGDCLLGARIDINKLYGRPGMAFIITMNMKEATLPGKYGTAPQLLLNGEPVHLEHPIKHGDKLTIKRGKDGTSPHFTIKELLGEMPSFTVNYNSKSYHVTPEVHVNGKQVQGNYLVKDHDKIVWKKPKTVKEFLVHIGKGDNATNKPFKIFINNQKTRIPGATVDLKMNGRHSSLNDMLKHGDIITWGKSQKPNLLDVLEKLSIPYYQKLSITFNQKQVTLKKQKITVYKNGVNLDVNEIINCDDQLTIVDHKEEPFIFQDVFRVSLILIYLVKGNFR